MPDDRYTGRVPVTYTLTAPLHHGAGSSGNVAILREQAAVNPETGEEFTSPFVSAASVRRAIRKACADLTLAASGAVPGTLGKPLIDLLFTGGVLTAGETAEVHLERHRRLDEAWPTAGLLGYATVGALWPGALYVDHLLPVCQENMWRAPTHLAGHPHADTPVGALIDDEFGTRGTGTRGDAAAWADGQWQQDPVPFEFQVLKPGTVLFSWFTLAQATRAQAGLLRHVWEQATAAGLWLGGMRARGFGHCTVATGWPDDFPPAAAPDAPDGLLDLLAEVAGR